MARPAKNLNACTVLVVIATKSMLSPCAIVMFLAGPDPLIRA
jgi:hypothetical protein